MATVTLKSGGISMDATDFGKFAKALRRAEPDLTKSLRTRLRAAGDLVAAEARSRASGVSKSIPPTIKVRVSGLTVSVVAGGKNAPLAGLFELGNKGGRSGGGGVFRHPVYGNRNNWVQQPTHPFLAAALQAKALESQQLILDAVDETIATVIAGMEI